MFPVFPGCSQFPTHAFNVFPVFSAPPACSINAVFYIPFFAGGNTGNNRNLIEAKELAG
jgi:hypothetical protein